MQITADPEFAALLPPPSTDEKAGLRLSIKVFGILVPIVVTSKGVVLDGHHRLRIATEFGIEPPYVVRHDLQTRTAQKAFVLASNLTRRNLSIEQRREVRRQQQKLAVELKAEGQTQEQVATTLGVDQATVSRWLSGNNMLSHNASLDARVKIPAQSYPLILGRVEEGSGVAQVAADLGVTPRRVRQIVGKARGEREAREQRTSTVCDTAESNLHTGDFRELAHLVDDDSVDLIFCDPPYDEESVPLYGDLGQFAARTLRPGGWCLSYSGHCFARQAMNLLAEHLTDGWMFTIVHTGGRARFRKLQLRIGAKPVLGFYKPQLNVWWSWFPDTVSGGREKSDHPWQQAQGEAEHFIKAMSPENGLVVDPFAGSGTTLAAAKGLGRRYVGFEIDSATAEAARRRLGELNNTANGARVPPA